MFDSLRAAVSLPVTGPGEAMPETFGQWLHKPIVHYPLALGVLILLVLVLLRIPDFLAWRRARGKMTLRPIDLDPLLQGDPPLILDLRAPEAFNGPHGHIRGSVNVPFKELGKLVHQAARDRRHLVVLVDDNDKLSHRAAAMMEADGYDWVRVLRGGLRAWRRQHLPVAGPNVRL
jgi:3-mercaptopyruvate sulfurtransferase SseA